MTRMGKLGGGGDNGSLPTERGWEKKGIKKNLVCVAKKGRSPHRKKRGRGGNTEKSAGLRKNHEQKGDILSAVKKIGGGDLLWEEGKSLRSGRGGEKRWGRSSSRSKPPHRTRKKSGV